MVKGIEKSVRETNVVQFSRTEVLEKVSVTNAEGPPVPIPNTEVKLCSGENTLRETAREDSSMLTLTKGSGEIHSCRLEKGETTNHLWGCSSAGRAPALQAGGHGFESHHLHHQVKPKSLTNHIGSELSRLERVPDKHEVGGSSPLGPTKQA